MQANLYALGAIALWASLASLGVSLTHIPPFLLTGIALIIGSVPAWPFVLRDPSQWRIPLRTLALGVYGLFAYHFLLFIALRHAPPVEANLVNYLWPLFIVVLSPVVLPGVALRLGPLGASFFMWDKALKLGDARHIGILSYITPLASTALLILVSGRAFTWSIALATAMIISAAVMGMRAR